jgi:lysozyme
VGVALLLWCVGALIATLDRLVELVKGLEGCSLKAYPDPKWHGIKRTKENWDQWGKPWTIAYGETEGVTEGMECTEEWADNRLRQRLGRFMLAVMHRCPVLFLEPPERTIACTSLAYNIGVGAFGASSICRRTIDNQFIAAANAFRYWNKAGGRVLRGLTIRRQRERQVYLEA